MEHVAGPPALARERREVRSDYDEEEEGEEEEEGGPSSLLTLLKTMLPPPTNTISLHEAQRSLERRAYSMQHFRWGKPKGKRRPIKVLLGMTASDPQEIESDLEAWPADVAMESRRSLGEDSEEEMTPPTITPTNRMQHIAAPANSVNPFLLGSAPGPSQKRYGGFMRPHTSTSHRDLLTLLKQAIAREHNGRY
ncbi:pro-opiomelanocortin B-like [Engraulis encrasicolus]|uniref:pro-opiomelanocortin B-like n=1 Tax=Engraulis encrasicolus TaxID=184585 RepID=UPI002FD71C41